MNLHFQEWMMALARLTSTEIVRLVRVPPQARRLLDIGGGHALYALAFCARFPQLSATVFDSPQALVSGRENIAVADMGERVTATEGDFLADSLGSGYDVALLFNVIHGFSDEQNQALLSKAAQALGPGGLLVVAEQLADYGASRAARTVNGLLGVSYLHLLGGRLYEYSQVAQHMSSAGITRVRRVDSPRLPGTSLVLGTRAA